MLRWVLISLFLIAIGISVVEVNGMALFKSEKVCVASGFEGQLLLKGQPVAGAKVERQFKWKDDKGESEQVTSDEKGYFAFPTHWDLLKQKVPSQFIVSQEIFVFHEDKKYQIWAAGKMTKGEFDEFNGKPYNMTCEISEELRRIDLEVGFAGTNCYWDAEPAKD